MSPLFSPEEAAATQALMAKVLKVVEAEKADHSMVINALANLASNFARKHPCCTRDAAQMFLQIGSNLIGGAVMVAMPTEAAPPGTPVH